MLTAAAPPATPSWNSIKCFSNDNVQDASNLLGIEFVSRIMVPYGPDETKGETYKDAPYSGYAYGVVS
jgi:hypothetical protein